MAHFLRKHRKKIDWRRGSSELVGLALVLPIICLILVVSMGVMQTGVMRQTLEYSTYMAARAAVTYDIAYDVSGTGVPTEVQMEAENTARMSLMHNTFGIDADNVTVNIELVGGTAMSGAIKWEKGALIKCTVTAPFESLVTMGEETMSCVIYSMVERPARVY